MTFRMLNINSCRRILQVSDRASSLEEGVRMAEEAIDSGAARDTVERFVARSAELAPDSG